MITILLLLILIKFSFSLVFDEPKSVEELKSVLLSDEFIAHIIRKDKLDYHSAQSIYKRKKIEQIKGLPSILREFFETKKDLQRKLEELKLLISAYEIPKGTPIREVSGILIDRILNKYSDVYVEIPMLSGMVVPYTEADRVYDIVNTLNTFNILEVFAQNLVNVHETFGKEKKSLITIEKFGSIEVLESIKPCQQYTKEAIYFVDFKIYMFFPFKKSTDSENKSEARFENEDFYRYSYVIPENSKDITDFVGKYITSKKIYNSCVQRILHVYQTFKGSNKNSKSLMKNIESKFLEEYFRVKKRFQDLVMECYECQTINDVIRFYERKIENLDYKQISRSYVTIHEREPLSLKQAVKEMILESLMEIEKKLKVDYIKLVDEIRNYTDIKTLSEKYSLYPVIKAVEVYPFIRENKFGLVVVYDVILKQERKSEEKVLNIYGYTLSFVKVKLRSKDIWLSETEIPIGLIRRLPNSYEFFDKQCIRRYQDFINLNNYPAVCIKQDKLNTLISLINRRLYKRYGEKYKVRLPFCNEMRELLKIGVSEKGKCKCKIKPCRPVIYPSSPVAVGEGELNVTNLRNLCGNVAEVCLDSPYIKAIGGHYMFGEDAYIMPLEWIYTPKPYFGLRFVVEVKE
ncbi:MAG: hypothetical protein DSY42_02625 [Aquifex sp.]|nr:MAG: hypothetical protein DSY42_02625 [Aquifex sp.]